MKKRKILVLTSSFPRNKNDWWAQFILNIYKNLPKRKFVITVLAPHAPDSKRKETLYGIKIARLPYFYPYGLQKLTSGSGILHSSKTSILGCLQIPFFILSEFVSTIYFLIRYQFDAIHAHWLLPQGLIAIMAKFIFKKPVIVTVHGSDIFGLKKFDFLKKIVLKHCDFCTVNSQATFRAVKKLNTGTKVKLIPMGVDLKIFSAKKRNPRWREKFGASPKIILAVGRFIPCKGFRFLIEAMPKVLSKEGGAKLILIGSGPEEKNLKKMAQDLNVSPNVIFTGSLSHRKLSQVYASSDIFVAPSITDPLTGETEGQNITLLEAMASGLPVIASDSGGMRDIVDGRSSGLLTKEGIANDIAEKIIYLLTHSLIKKKFRQNGFNLVKRKYSWEKIGKRFLQIYGQLLINR